MSSLPVVALLGIFVLAAAAIWIAGIELSKQTDVLSTRLHLGAALGGLLLLAVATNLPEIAITVSASLSGDVGVAVGNILGGIAIQTVVLVVLDAVGVRGRRPLTYQAASLVLVLEAALVVAVLAVVVAGSQLPPSLVVLRLTPAPVLIAIVWVGGLLLLRRAQQGLPWQQESGAAPDGQRRPRGHSREQAEHDATGRGVSTARAGAVFGAAAVVTLLAGVALERSGDAIASHVGLTGVLFGATVLAAATSLPEVSTGLTSVRQGDVQLAVSDIFGGNAFLPVLFLPATVLSGSAVLPQASASDIYLTALAMLLTLVYAAGLVLRPRRRLARMGVDSVAVLVLYALGLAGLVAIVASG